MEEQLQKDQLRTSSKKRLFLDYWERTTGVIAVTCRKVEISRETFYQWCRTDPEFKREIETITRMKNDLAEDLLWLKVLEGDGPSVRYWLSRNDPEYQL